MLQHITIITLLLSYAFNAQAEKPDPREHKKWQGEVAENIIVINNEFGDVRLRHGDGKNIIEYRAVIQQLHPGQRLDVDHKITQDKRFEIKVSKQIIDQGSSKKNTNNATDSRLDLLVYIPANKKVKVVTVDGLIEAKGMHAELELSTESGLISANKPKGPIQTNNVNGETKLILEQQGLKEQTFSSIYGPISALISENASFNITVSSSGDIISDFSTEVIRHRKEEPDKTVMIKINDGKSELVFSSKRGVIAIRERRDYSK